MFDWLAWLIGFLVGIFIIVIIFFIAFWTRSFLFTFCPTNPGTCVGADYFNDPGDALANGAKINDILFLDSLGHMIYKRVPRVSTCTPGADQVVPILFPQFCSFDGIDAKALQLNSSMYKLPSGLVVDTEGNCVPTPGQPVVTGNVVIRWDPNPIAD